MQFFFCHLGLFDNIWPFLIYFNLITMVMDQAHETMHDNGSRNSYELASKRIPSFNIQLIIIIGYKSNLVWSHITHDPSVNLKPNRYGF